MENAACDQSPGTITRDADGFYAAHSGGKIRLKLIPPPSPARRFLLERARRMRRTIEWW
jgi:hypothetical protein